jgi:hypothetical protein
MDTGSLRGFAGLARVSLLAGVAARLGVVLAAGSDARAVEPELVAGLEREVAAAGGGEAGRQSVVDRMAYTWFNRITALRFMDAAGITTIKVVSPVPGGVQPEVLTAAKQGVFEDAVPPRDRERVTGYLTGALASPNPDRDAYGVLLAAYCRWWNQAMPFLFEKATDYTELLIPQDLLADDSVRDKAVKTLTPEVCEDVEVIGWLYQFYIADRKDEVFAGFKKGKRAGAAEIPAATQLFTPHWIVRYLVENSLGRLWLLNHPDSALRDRMEYYIDPVDVETGFLRIGSPEEIKVIDPACGSGHMLTYAFDLLYAIYEEEGYPPSDIPTLILSHNLFGTEIDERAGTLAAFALAMKARLRQKTFLTKKVVPNVSVLRNVVFTPDELDQLRHPAHHNADEDKFWNLFAQANLFGALVIPNEMILTAVQSVIDALPDDDLLSDDLKARAQTVADQASYLSERYHIVIANPPYMGSGNMGAALAAHLSREFPDEKQDLYTCFVARAFQLGLPMALIGMVVADTWMTHSTFERFRVKMLDEGGLISCVHLDDVSNHPDVFGANTAFILEGRTATESHSSFIHLQPLDAEIKRELLLAAIDDPECKWRYSVAPANFRSVPGRAFAYRMGDAVRDVFAAFPKLASLGDARQGPSPGDTARFVRLWFEVGRGRTGIGMANRADAKASGKKWFPLNKGGAFRRWFGNVDHVINWFDDGRELFDFRPRSVIRNPNYYFRPAVTWSSVSSGESAFRAVDEGVIFSDVGQSIFADDSTRTLLLAILNSRFGTDILALLAPSLHVQAGIVESVPVSPDLELSHVELVEELVAIARADWETQETSSGFGIPDWRSESGNGSLAQRTSERLERWLTATDRTLELESDLDALVQRAYGLPTDQERRHRNRVPLVNNPHFGIEIAEDGVAWELYSRRVASDLVSYSVGCLLGRFSLDQPGLVLADQGDSFETFIERVPGARFLPDRDNVIPIVDGDWFEDDIVARFREWLRIALGPEHVDENWRYLEDTLGRTIRQYFVKDFYSDHVKRYKKRPIYWLFSSPKGTFSALVYLHRYSPSLAGTVLHDYVLPFLTKLETELVKQEHLAITGDTPRTKAVATKQAEVLRKQIVEVRDWATNTLQPLADKQLAIDLDDGVKHNYPLLGSALKKIPGLDTPNE